MSIYKIAKSIAKRTGEDVKEVYKKFLKNKRKLRRMEDKARVESYEKQAEFHSPRPLAKRKRAFKTQSRSRS